MPAIAEGIQRVQVSTEPLSSWKTNHRQVIKVSNCSSFYRRGLIDMRKRFRGNQPISVSTTEGGGSSSSQQLYAGKPAFETVKEISGDEVQMDPEKTRGL